MSKSIVSVKKIDGIIFYDDSDILRSWHHFTARGPGGTTVIIALAFVESTTFSIVVTYSSILCSRLLLVIVYSVHVK